MSFSHLNIHDLRNISSVELTLNSRFNLICGPNGSGKTSLLEAIYLLSCGQSFRTRESAPLIQNGKGALMLFARTFQNETISLQKTLVGTKVKINQQPCLRSSDLAHFNPCQLFYQDIFQIIDAGPSVRRSLLDWGLFHVKQSFHEIWKKYRSVLKQRNALLRQKAKRSEFLPWDRLLVDLSIEIDTLRQAYFYQWLELFKHYLLKLTDTPCSLTYYKGWDKKSTSKSLMIILEEQFLSDLQRQYTQSGAHQADILFESDDVKSRQILSRGQQKIILIALKLAQTKMISKPCIYLLDDISAELDHIHLQKLLQCLFELDGQFFLTCLQSETIWDFCHAKEEPVSLFLMNRGFPSLVSQQ